MDVETLRSRGDLELAEKLRAEPAVKRAIEALAKREEDGPRGTRRHLLATSLRLTPAMHPQLARVTDECAETLGVTIPLETYVYPSAQFNAACVKPEAGRLFVMLSSSLLEAFEGGELRFVMGHELGHYLFGHHDIPVGVLLSGERKPPPELALRLFAWSRYAEISCDRTGAVCAKDPTAMMRALFRLASGLGSSVADLDISEFAEQVDEMRYETDQGDKLQGPRADWFSTHPFSPLRVKALELFNDSALAVDGGLGSDELAAEVQTLMALMEPSYLEEKSAVAETMRRLLMAGALAVIAADGTVDPKEVEVFESFFGEGFHRGLDHEAIAADLDSRVADALANVPHARRIQVVRDLCVVARADDIVHETERALIVRLARELEVSEVVVRQTLEGEVDHQ